MEVEVVKELEVNMEQIGPQGYSAYEVYVQNGGTLSETEWLASLKGDAGEKGDKGDTGSVKFIVVTDLPTENIDTDAIYIKPVQDPQEQNIYEEFIYVNNKWESLGTPKVEVDLSNYPTTNDVKAITGELDNLSTEDKTNLVNAINEVASNSGITKLTDSTVTISTLNVGVYLLTTSVSYISYGSKRYMTGSYMNCPMFIDYYRGKKYAMFISNQVFYVFDTSGNRTEIPISNISMITQNETITGTKTFNTLPKSSVTPSDDTHLVNKKYVDDAIASLKAELTGGSE